MDRENSKKWPDTATEAQNRRNPSQDEAGLDEDISPQG